jgi:ABC-2 type transport system ATP-binding protein
MSNAIETHGVQRRMNKAFEIRDLSLCVPTGSIYGFLGPNGSGKTTTIRLLLGLLRPSQGSIALLGRAVPADLPHILARTGFVPERPHLYAGLTVGGAVRYHSAFYRTWDAARAESLRQQFRLDPTQRVGRLSKGETGKLLVLLALAQSPDLLVLDEPTDGLDPVVRRDVLSSVLDYVSQHGATVFISSHLVHELERFCDWVGVMDDGRLVAEMPMETFKNGIKRLRVLDGPAVVDDAPFMLLAREPSDGVSTGEVWVVRNWQASMSQYFEKVGASLREVVDLDLEEGFVELLRTFRSPTA